MRASSVPPKLVEVSQGELSGGKLGDFLLGIPFPHREDGDGIAE